MRSEAHRSLRQLDDLGVGDIALVQGQRHQGAHHLPSLHAGCARIDDEAAQVAVGHDLEDVAVAAHEQLGP